MSRFIVLVRSALLACNCFSPLMDYEFLEGLGAIETAADVYEIAPDAN